MQSLAKITAGDGYEYMTRNIAAGDSTELGRSKLTDYYSDKGESPGMWLGSGLPRLGEEFGITDGEQVTAEQMKALFGEGLHPNADMIMRAVASKGGTVKAQLRAVKLGRAFTVHSGATPFRVEVAKRFNAYNKAAGEKWNAPIPAEERARIRTDVSREFFVKEHGRAPLDDRELSGWTAELSRQKTTDVAGFDMAFTPPKSISALWALAPLDVARVIEECHDQAIRDTLAYHERWSAHARIGTNGIGQVDTHGVIAAAFRHRDSRAGDPNLHTHVCVSNVVQVTMPDGSDKWLRLDAAGGIYPMNVSGSEHYNTRIDQLLRARLPIDTFDRGDGVMEIAGVDLAVCDAWSKRARMIDGRTSELSLEFQRQHGREPTPVESLDLRDQAWQETRQAKHAPKSHADQRAEWREFAASMVDPDRLVAEALSAPVKDFEVTDEWLSAEAGSIVEVVSGKRARWQANHVEAEIQRRIRYAGVRDGDHGRVTEGLRERAAALSIRLEAPPLSVKGLEPDCLRRRDGRSIYHRALSDHFTSRAVLDAEDRLVNAAGLTGGVQCSGLDVDLALVECAANGKKLNAGQVALVRSVALSDRRVQVALAPAGSGKTTAMQALGRAWNQTRGHQVLGLAPTAKASAALRDELQTTTDNVAKLNQLIASAGALQAQGVDTGIPQIPVELVERARLANGSTTLSRALPEWFRAVGPGTLAVLDEAGMVGLRDLDSAVGYLLWAGADSLLIGDTKQLPAVQAGGVITDIAVEHGAQTLSHVVRFTDPGEGPASLALRLGDESALGFYADKGRVHCGGAGAVMRAAYEAWRTDVADGADSLLLAYAQDTVNTLNGWARDDRLMGTDPGAEVDVAHGLRASVGDTVVTRSNNRRLMLNDRDWVRNGDRWAVEHVLPTGDLWVRHVQLRRTVILPSDYVREHVELGYARTIHTAQGSTAGGKRQKGTSHTVFTGAETRELFYTPATRGRDENHIYLATALDGDMHDMVTSKGVLPDSWLDMARGILAREGEQTSARSAQRELADPHKRLEQVARSYDHAVGVAAEAVAGSEVMARIDAAADEVWHGVRDAGGWPVLRQHLALMHVSGRDACTELAEAAGSRELRTAEDVAAVLGYRLDTGSGRGPLPWLPEVPNSLRAHPEWGQFLSTFAADVDLIAADVRRDALSWSPSSAPAWARPYVDSPDLCADLAVWRAARGVEQTDRRPTGGVEREVGPKRAQDQLVERARAAATDPDTAAGRWATRCVGLDPRIVEDPFWLEFASNLDRLDRAGVDVVAKLDTAMSAGVLPRELAASALWWRVAAMTEAGALDASGSTVAMRPGWTIDLYTVLGESVAERVLADAAWPKLVAAVEDADPGEVRELLQIAHDMITVGHEDEPLPVGELAGALAWRVEMLANDDRDIVVPAEVEAPPDEGETVPEGAPELAPDDVAALFEEPAPEPVPLAELRATADAARAEYDALRVLVDVDRGPYMVASEGMLEALRVQRDAQAPFATAARDADLWAQEREREATRAERWVAELVSTRPEPDGIDRAVEAVTGTPAGAVVTWEAEVALARMDAAELRTAADTARSEADVKRAEWRDAAGGEGRMVDQAVYLAVRNHAGELDSGALAQVRRERDRAVSAADRRLASERTAQMREARRRQELQRRRTSAVSRDGRRLS